MKIIRKVKYIVLILGSLLLLLASVLFYNAQEFDKNAITTTGVVTELIEKTVGKHNGSAPAIRFYTKTGKMIDFVSSEADVVSTYKVGDEVTILYNQKEPTHAVIKGFFSVWGASMAFALVGFGLFFMGCLLFVREQRKAKKIKQLLDTGTAIQASIQKVALDIHYKVGNTNPFIIYAQWLNPKTQNIHIFKSDHIWYNPNDHINTNHVTVYINKDNPAIYHMDLSFLPKLAE